jgi:hypothetical protein
MEKIFGPFNGYVAVVCVRDVSGCDNQFAASYELWRGAPHADDPNAKPVRQKPVGGLSESIDEAVAIALQLARLHIAGLPAPGNRLVTPKVDATSSPAQFAKSWEADPQGDFMTYQPTMACPLQPSCRSLNP